MKDHGATGATGCLKNIAYGSFSNVARTHYKGKSHTLLVRGGAGRRWSPCARGRCCRSWTACAASGTAGPFARTRRYVFYPKQIFFGTDPVAIDRLLLDIIDEKRKAEGAISIYDRSPRYLKMDDGAARDADPNVNIIIREPGHVEYAAKLGLGVADLAQDQGPGHRGMTVLLVAGGPAVPLLDAGAESARRRSSRRGSSGCACRPSRPRRGGRPASRRAHERGGPGAARDAARARHQPARTGPGLGDAQPLGRRERVALPCATPPGSTSTSAAAPARPRWPPRRRPPTARTPSSRSIPRTSEALGQMTAFLSQLPASDLPGRGRLRPWWTTARRSSARC